MSFIKPKSFYSYERPSGARRTIPGLDEPGFPIDEDPTYAGEENPRKYGAMAGLRNVRKWLLGYIAITVMILLNYLYRQACWLLTLTTKPEVMGLISGQFLDKLRFYKRKLFDFTRNTCILVWLFWP